MGTEQISGCNGAVYIDGVKIAECRLVSISMDDETKVSEPIVFGGNYKGDVLFTCPICKSKQTSKSELSRHIYFEHKNVMKG